MRFLLTFLIALLLSGCSFQNEQILHDIDAKEGKIDLRHITLIDYNKASLSGEWSFYWNELLLPEELSERAPGAYIELPRLWNDFEYDGELLPSYGYATYQLTINLNKADIGRPQALYIPYLHTAYNIYIDGDLKGSVGNVGTSKEEMTPKYLPQIIFFSPSSEQVDVVFHVSNFVHAKGGFVQDLLIGNAESIANYKERRVANNLFLFGSFLIISIYHLAIFVYRKMELSSLVFSIFCLVIAIRMLLIDQVYLIKVFPDFNWVLAMKFEYLANYGGFILFLLFIKSIFPTEVNEKIYRVLLAVVSLYTFIMIVTPPSVFTYLFKNFTFVALTCIAFCSFVFIKAVIKKREGSKVSFVGGILLCITAAFDFLYSYGAIVLSGYIMPIGFFAFIFSQSLVLSIKYAKTFVQVSKLNNQLKDLNDSLEEKVQIRTEKLKSTMKETASAIAEKSVLEERARIVRDIHDTVGHTLTSIIVQIEAGKRLINKDPDSSIQRLNASQDMIRSGLDEIRRLLRILKTDDIKQGFIDSLEKLIVDTEYHTNVNIDEKIELKTIQSPSLQHVLFRALQEGITNGIRHGKSKNFHFHLYETDFHIIFKLTDDGKGTNHIHYGIGLSSMIERVQELAGSIELISGENQGFSIFIRLPIIPMDTKHD